MAERTGPVQRISAITLATADMARAFAFYTSLGFVLRYGGPDEGFSSFVVGEGYLNLTSERAPSGWWGRVIFYVDDVDALHARALELGYEPQAPPRDAPWDERYFHLTDPDGHELSFASPRVAQGDAVGASPS